MNKTLFYACDAAGCDAGGRIRAFTIRGAVAIARDEGWQMVDGTDDPVLCPHHVTNPPGTVLR